MTTYFKVLGPNAESIHGGTGTWHKPSETHPGKWMPAVKDVKCCERGYHLVELDALPEWLRADCTIWEAEGKGASHTNGTGKTAFAQARLLKRLYLSERDLRLCAADFSEHVLHIFERTRPGDDRPRKAIEAARAYARGEIDATQLAAARDAAWAAADAARDAAWAAAADAAGVAERQWQGERLATYLREMPDD